MEKQERLDSIFGEGKYTLSNFIDWKTKGEVTCNKHKVTYLTSPASLFNQHISGCPKCKSENLSKSKVGSKWNGRKPPVNYLTAEKFLAKVAHENITYGDFEGRNVPMDITCEIHSVTYKQTPANHLRSRGCMECLKDAVRVSQIGSKDDFIAKAKAIHGDEYNYSKSEYKVMLGYVDIVCPTHGVFNQRADNHCNGNGCPKCKVGGKVAQEFIDFFKSLGFVENVDFLVNDRTLIAPLELDFYFPKLKVAIEFNGDFFHSDIEKNYHLNKKKQCEQLGVNLIHIYEHQFNSKKMIILNRLKNMLGKNDKRVYARKCLIKEVSFSECKVFLEQNHLQGNSTASIRLGLYIKGALVALMTFGKPRFNKHYDYELIRYCGDVIGGASKLLSHFYQAHPKATLISYANRDWTSINSNLYATLGFTLHKISPPNYVWINHTDVISRYKSQMKNEQSVMRDRGYRQLFDCGSLVYVKNPPKNLSEGL